MKVTQLLFILTFISSTPALATIRALTTITDLAWALKQVGGDKVEVQSLLSANEDPHFAMALPSFIFKARKADLICYVGLELEIGWLPKIVEKSANSKILKGAAGDCDTSRAIKALEAHQGHIDRSMGDVHAGGNPHYTLSPFRMKKVISYYLQKLTELAPSDAVYFETNAAKTLSKLDELIEKTQASVKQAKLGPLMEYHKEFTYFINDYSLKSAGSVESVPGVPPSAAEVLGVTKNIQKKGVTLILAGLAANENVLKKIKENSKADYLIYPAIMNSQDYFEHINSLVAKVIERAQVNQ